MNKNPSQNFSYFIILIVLSSISFTLFLWELNYGQDVKDLVIYNSISLKTQALILRCILLTFVVMTILTFWTLTADKAGSIKKTLGALLKFIIISGFLPCLFNKGLFRTYPSCMILITTVISVYVFFIFKEFDMTSFFGFFDHKITQYVFLTLMVLGYGIYFSYFTIINHYNLGTLTYDQTFYQNPLINTVHGHFMTISFEPFNGSNIFRAHCDFVLMLYLPFFYVLQKVETLLTVQSFTIALAAVPLFFLSREILKDTFASLLIVLFYLFHPANHSANFYDFHELSFLPLAAFSIFYFLEKKNVQGFLWSIIFLLSIKVDMFIYLMAISMFIFFKDRKDVTFSIYALSASVLYALIYILFLKKWVLGAQVYYFNGLFVKDAPVAPMELFKTAVTNPVFLLKVMLTKDKIIFIFLLLGPLVFVPAMQFRNLILFFYGFAFTLLADRDTTHTIHFQYIWYIIPGMFVGMLYTLREMKTIAYPMLIAIFFATTVYSWQYGAVLNRSLFRGGFNQINFDFTTESKKRLQALDAMIRQIPTNASVSASESLTSHFIQHGNMKRFSELISEPDYILLLDPDPERPDLQVDLIRNHGYKIIEREGGFQLLKRF